MPLDGNQWGLTLGETVKRILFTAVVAFFSSTSANALWDIQNSGEDVFGNVNVTATSLGDNGNLIRFECGSSADPFAVFLVRDSSGEIPEVPSVFLHIDQDGDRHESDAVLRPWNEKYLAVMVTDTAMLKRLAEHMIVAQKSISVGVSVPLLDIKIADTFSSRGSTSAGRVLLKHCLS